MKIRIILPLIAAVFNRLLPIGGGDSTTLVPFSSVCISPLHYSEQSDVIVSTPQKTGAIKILISNDICDSTEILHIAITQPGSYCYKLDNSFVRSTNRIKVKCVFKKNLWLTSDEIEMKATTPKVKYITNNDVYEPETKFQVLNMDLKWDERKASYSFQNFEGLYVPSFYHKIDLNDFEIFTDWNSKYSFSCSPTLVIKNINGVFDDITGSNSSVGFKLRPKETKNGFSFELADPLYVNKETLLLSSTPKDGYVQTRHIYLPRNEMRVQDKYDAYFVFENFGINLDLLYYRFELMALKNTFGDCRNSEYCIQEEHV